MRLVVAAVLGVLLASATACQVRAAVRPSLPALTEEGEVAVYLQPFPLDAARLTLELNGIALVSDEVGEVPLELLLPEVGGATARDQRRLAWGRVPPGRYSGLSLRLSRATLAGEEQPADLLVPKEPIRVPVSFMLRRGHAMVVSVALREGQALDAEQGLATLFTAAAAGPESAVVQLSGYSVEPGQANLTMFSRPARRVTALLPTGREPRSLAIDALGRRGYLSLGGEDQIEVFDLSSGEPLERIYLRAGDQPGEVALTPDGKLLVVLGHGSSTVAFVDVDASIVLDRLAVPEEPESLLIDPSGRRAYVLSRHQAALTVLDLATRSVAAAVHTDPEPVALQLNRAGTRLQVIHRGSAYLTTYSVPDLAVLSRTYVGLGAAALKVDPRTDFIYLGRSDRAAVEVYDPFSLVPIDAITMPGPVGWLTLDMREGTLLAVIPSKGIVAVIDLASRRIRALLEVGRQPDRTTLVGERY